MKGKHCGPRKRILEINKRGLFIICLHLVLNDAAIDSVSTVTFWNNTTIAYFLWPIKKTSYEVSSVFGSLLTLKQLCLTRWEANIESFKKVRYQIGMDASFEDEIRSKTNSFFETIEDSFLLSLTSWYEVLFGINIASKILQSKNVNLPKLQIF